MNHPGQRLRRLLLQHLKPKCHILLLDEQINSRKTILRNIYHIVSFVAIKFYSYICSFTHLKNNEFLWSKSPDLSYWRVLSYIFTIIGGKLKFLECFFLAKFHLFLL